MKLKDILNIRKKSLEFDVANWYRIGNSQNGLKSKSLFIQSVINKISTDLASSDITFFSKKNLTSEQRKLLYALKVKPNDLDSPINLFSNLFRDVIINGTGYLFYYKDFFYNCHLDNTGNNVKRYSVNNFSYEKDLPVNSGELLTVNSPKLQMTKDINNISTLLDMEMQLMEQEFNEQTNLSGFLKLGSNVLDEDTAKKIKTRINEMYDLAKDGGIGYLNSNEEFIQLTRDLKKISDTRFNDLRDNLLLSFGISQNILKGDYTEQQFRAYILSLECFRKELKQELNKTFITRFDYEMNNSEFSVNYDLNLITDVKDLTDFIFKAKYTGVMNANEIRDKYFNLPAYENGDIYETNLNAIPVNDSNE